MITYIMENTMEELNTLMKSTNIKIKESIDINMINNLIESIEEQKPIPIAFYSKPLIELKNNKQKCHKCKRIGQYSCDNNIYCWIHAQNLF